MKRNYPLALSTLAALATVFLLVQPSLGNESSSPNDPVETPASQPAEVSSVTSSVAEEASSEKPPKKPAVEVKPLVEGTESQAEPQGAEPKVAAEQVAAQEVAQVVSILIQAQSLEAAVSAAEGVGAEITHRLGIIDAVAANVTVEQRTSLEKVEGLKLHENSRVEIR